MSSIYNKKQYADLLDGGLSGTPSRNQSTAFPDKITTVLAPEKIEDSDVQRPMTKYKEPEMNLSGTEVAAYQERSMNAMKLVDDVVLKNYLTRLSEMDVVPLNSEELSTDNIILFKINKMVYEKDEYATDKFISVVSAMTFSNSSIYLIADGHKDHTDFYLGIKCEDSDRTSKSISDTFKNALLGQFPGAQIGDFKSEGSKFVEDIVLEDARQRKLLHRISEAVSVSSCVGIPSYKNSKGEYTNANFIQGIEKFASAMQGKEYTAIVLASNVSRDEIANIRNGYENVYTELSAMATRQLAYSTNESLANALSRTKGYSDTVSHNDTKGTSDTEGRSSTETSGESHTTTTTKGSSKDNAWGKAGKLASPLMEAGAILTGTGVGAPIGAIMMGVGAVAGLGSLFKGKQLTESTSQADGTSSSHSESINNSHTTNESHSDGTSHAENFSETNGTTSTVGSSKNFTITIQNKHILEVQKRIDKQLERIELCESTGLWSAGAYFMSYDTDRATAEIGATIFRSIMQGEQSGVENSAINTWYPETEGKYKSLINYVSALSHPIFEYTNPNIGANMQMLPTSLLSSQELAIMMGLPRKSVPGLPVIEHVSMAKEVVRLNPSELRNEFNLGCIFDQGVERLDNKVRLDAKSLTQHTFVTGSTGCGKSNTIYYLINQIRNQANAPKFLVIEPAKGEYKDVFGNEHIYGTNPKKTPLLRINPFRFPEGVHVLEHIDRLVEIFNVCWPMYAAMPAVLKEATLNAYEDCGWDLYESQNKYSNELFPTFADLKNELILVINNSAYSEEVKSNYIGSLVTRVNSLTNGINKEIFSGCELGDSQLFDENVIVDLSRIGSQETKALIMGILVMRLNEYRSNSNIEHNSPLRHITILEEAHNILKKCSQEQSMEGSNVAGKSVEMISNSIAEMRTFGEGFIIVDQSPGAVDISAIRNTNTKIIMRLPEDSDRQIAGKSAAMKDSEIDEIAKLPTGVAVVYQNDWEAPVLCKIGKFSEKPIPYNPIEDYKEDNCDDILPDVLALLLQGRVSEQIAPNIQRIKSNINRQIWSTANKWAIYEAIDEYETSKSLHLWNDSNFEVLSRLISELLSLKEKVLKLTASCTSFKSLTDSLFKLIKERVPDFSEGICMELAHCLMCDYAKASATRMKVYSAWVQNVKSENEN